jgi:hypothetical protein
VIAPLFLCLALQVVSVDQDVIHLKDGTTRSGRILSESKDEMVLETLIKGAKAQIVGAAKVTVPRGDIVSVDRTSPEYRRQAEARSKNFGERGIRRFEALNRIVPVAVKFQGLKGYRVTGTHYVLESSCDVPLVKDVALCLEEIFAAYERYFGIRRNGEKKVSVLMFADRLEYDFYNMHAIEGKMTAPAYYRIADNTIAAYNMIQKEKELLIRTDIRNYQEDLDRFRNQVMAFERQFAAILPELRQKIADEYAEYRKSVRADEKGGKEKRLADLNQQEAQAVADLKDGKNSLTAELSAARRAAGEQQEKCRQLIEHNENVLALQNRAVFETLYHEAFHAFAATYLWEGSGQKEFPRWLHEGMAGYFESAATEGAILVHGAPHAGFMAVLREKLALRTMLPVQKILRGGPEQFTLVHPTDAARQTQYYAQSWAMAHYLAAHVSKEQLEEYVVALVSGKDPVESFERLTGKSGDEFETALKAHLDALK